MVRRRRTFELFMEVASRLPGPLDQQFRCTCSRSISQSRVAHPDLQRTAIPDSLYWTSISSNSTRTRVRDGSISPMTDSNT